MPRVSIIIPAYNAENFIAETLNSILAQTLKDFECIIIDDGSTDKTVSVVKRYKDDRIKLYEETNSGGPARPRNLGISKAQGEYIFLFDSDDIMFSEKLERAVTAMDKHRDADFLFTNFQIVDEKGGLKNNDFLSEYETLWKVLGSKNCSYYLLNAFDLIPALIQTNFIGTSSVALRKSALSELDVFNENLRNADDYLFWTTFLRTHKAIFLNSIDHQYRVQPNSISSRAFTSRGPSRIESIAAMKRLFSEKHLLKLLNRKLCEEYLSMAYSCKVQGRANLQIRYAFKSLRLRFNTWALKMIIHGLYFNCRNLLISKQGKD